MEEREQRAGGESFTGRLFVTIDTEMDADVHWEKHYPPTYTSVLEGIPELFRPIWNRYGVHPIYFVSPEVVAHDGCCEVLREELKQGAIIGAHLHPEYIAPEPADVRNWGKESFPCYACSTELERKKLQNLTKMMEEKLGKRPVWYRAARFGADEDTFRILRDLGYTEDSSLTPCINWTEKGGPNHAKTPCLPYNPMEDNVYQPAADSADRSLREHPVTICGKRLGLFGRFLPENWLMYRWLRPTHMTYLEQKHLIRRMRADGQQELVMMFHSMEPIIGKTPYVRSRWMQRYYLWRLEKTIQFAGKMGYRA